MMTSAIITSLMSIFWVTTWPDQNLTPASCPLEMKSVASLRSCLSSITQGRYSVFLENIIFLLFIRFDFNSVIHNDVIEYWDKVWWTWNTSSFYVDILDKKKLLFFLCHSLNQINLIEYFRVTNFKWQNPQPFFRQLS